MASEETEKLFGDHKIPRKEMTKRMLALLRPEMGTLVLALFLIFLNVIFDVILPQIMSKVTGLLEDANGSAFIPILMFAIGYFVLACVSQVFLYVESMIVQKAGQRIVYKLRMEVFEHIEGMSQNQFNEMPVGSLVTRVASYTASLSDLFTNVAVSIIRNVCVVVACFGILAYNSWKIALLMLPFMTLVFLVSFFFEKIFGKAYRAERKANSDLDTFLSENLSGMRIIQVFNQQARKKEEFDEKSRALKRAKLNEVLAFGFYRPVLTFIYYGAVATSFGLSYKFGLTGPELVAVHLYLARFFEPIQAIADNLNHIEKAVTASERLFNLMDVKPQVLDAPDAIDVERFDGHIEFKNVWFAYIGEEWILRDVSFEINPKETCAFVGATGAGKTTILSLIVRNFEIQKGQILIDGIDIKKIKIKSLRKAIGQMLQDVFLFSGNIKTNITLHDESFTDEQVMEACRYVNADKFINKRKEGLDCEVIENGENFSQGQKQLLSFARTVIHKPQILILDEATANIDTETEVLIQESLEKMKNVGTMLVVAHRLSTIQKADQIIVLQHGEVIEKGNHQELLKQKGYYYKLYQLQFNND